MNTTDETIIELSRKKLALLILGACVGMALSAWLLSQDAAVIRYERSFRFFYNSPPLVYGLSLTTAFFSGLCGLFALRKMFDKRPGLVLNSAGLVDNASGVTAGFIPWSDVTGSRIYEFQRARMLIINVRDPRKYTDRGGALRRAFNKANAKMGGGPVAIPSNTLKIDFPELVALFHRYYRTYGGAPAARES